MLLSPFLCALTTALLSAFVRGRALLLLNLGGGAAVLVSSLLLLLEVAAVGRVSVAVGNWSLPYGIEFAADGLSALLLVSVSLVAFAVLLYQTVWRETAASRGLYPLQHGLVAASIAVCIAADLFNLYVWFELLLITLLGLLVLGGKTRHHEAAFKYFTLSMIGTLLLLAAVGLIHGATGHLNFSALHEAAQNPPVTDALPLYVGLLFTALLIKAAAFPLFAWLPASYHTLPAPLLALVGGLLTKITLYVLLRLSGQVFDVSFMLDALGWLAVMTMLSGVIGAAYHWDIRRILAFHIISQIGYLMLGVALASAAGRVAGSFFLLHNLLVKANLFLIAGLMWQHAGHYDLRKIGGLYPAQLWLAVLFLINAFSLVGVPPSSGFWGKYLLVVESFHQERFMWAGIALATGFLTLYSMNKIWLEAFWKAHPDAQHYSANAAMQVLPAYAAVALLSLVIIGMGVYPEPLIAFLNTHSAGFWSTP